MDLTWHGHSTWHVDVDGTTFLIDPFFQNPMTELSAEDVATPDFVLLTHGHADHVADAGAFTDATVVGVPELTAYMEEEVGFGSSVGMNIGGTVECGDAFVTMHRADHTNGLNTDYEYSLGPPTGFLISDEEPTQESDPDATTFYHAGDTGLMSEMKDVIGPYLEPDAAALPVGDHFTMGPTQAAIATEWLGVDHLLPMHYDTFPPVEIDTDDLRSEVSASGSDAEVHLLAGDETFALE
ncbi:MAG: metal-dependent hydrolase [Halobellus sp.]|uniref:metal-dependent hydrolase n=1 Tax=Halobellus sp. TaxID=1979212 RepID=UPI0035D4762C